jgi:hypothetical protein
MPTHAAYPPFEAIHDLYTLASSTSGVALLSIDPSLPLEPSSLLRAADGPLELLSVAAYPSASPSAVRSSAVALFHVTAALYALHAIPLFGNRYTPATVLDFLYAHMVHRIAGHQDHDESFAEATVSQWLTSAIHEWDLFAAYCSSSFQLSGFPRFSECAADFLNYLAFILRRVSLQHHQLVA